MTGIIYYKLMPATRETVSALSGGEQVLVRSSIETLIQPSLAQGGIWPESDEVEEDIMRTYRGFSSDRLKGTSVPGTADGDVRFIAEHIQLYLPHTKLAKSDSVLSWARLEPSEGNEEQVDKVMRNLGYSKFELNEGYKDNLRARNMTPEDVMNGQLTFGGLVVLLNSK